MKKKIIAIIMLLMVSVTIMACSKSKYKTYDKDLSIVSLSAAEAEEDKAYDIKDLTAKETLKLKFIEGEDYIPYIDPLSYFAFIPDDLHDKTKYVDDEDEVAYVFEVNNKKASIRIFPKTCQVIFEDQLSYIYENEDEDSAYLVKTKLNCIYNKSVMQNQVINYKEYDFKVFRENNKTYFPLAFLNTLVNAEHTTNVFYNYDKLYLYDEPSKLIKVNLLISGKKTTAYDEMKTKTVDVMPEYLRKFNKNYLYFIFDNFYGLNEQKGITKMSTYFESLDYSKWLLSENPEERANGFALMLASLDDGHTADLALSDPWNEDNTKNLPQSMKNDREKLEKALKAERKRVYTSLGLDENKVRYSKDGKTASITLDSFVLEKYMYNEDKTIKTDAKLAETDTYYKILENLREIDKKGGVSNVVIDMSVNAGGNSIAMLKILNLINSKNQARISFRDSSTNVFYDYDSQIDSNNDGKYDDNDVYGNKYKFAILLSPVAFSCGTAMPFFAYHNSLAYTVGQNPGGGECALGQCVLPNGQIIAYSSHAHVTYIKDGNYYGDEGGAEVDLPYSYFDFYDLDKLGEKLKSFIEVVESK